MTLLIPLLLRLTALFERGIVTGESSSDTRVVSEESSETNLEKE